MEALDALAKYFKGGQAESEKEIIEKIFVTPENVSEITNFVFTNYKIVSAPKGAGKSILLEYLNKYYLKSNVLSLLVDPKEFEADAIHEKKVNSEKIKEGEKQLLEMIAAKLGESISFAVSDSSVNLTKIWEKQKGRPNLTARIKNFLIDIVPNDYRNFVYALSNMQDINLNTVTVTEDVTKHLSKTDKKFVLMIDNIDSAVEEKNQRFDYSTCWAIIESAINIANKIDNIVVLISIRTDIWHTMTKVKNLGSSVLDKIPRPCFLVNSEKAMQHIFLKRLELAESQIENRSRNTLLNFFENEWISLPGRADTMRTWDQWISKNSRNRPRDMVQLVQKLILAAKRRDTSKYSKISQGDLIKTIDDHGRSSLNNIEKEYFQICSNLKSVFRYFENKTRYDFIEITKILEKCPSESLQIDGVTLHPGVKEDAIKILRLLYMANFLNPRIEVDDIKYPDGYKHVLFEEEPDFIDPDNYNKLQNVIFEIHPTFHELVKSSKSP